jgi:hypothetical protein
MLAAGTEIYRNNSVGTLGSAFGKFGKPNEISEKAFQRADESKSAIRAASNEEGCVGVDAL